MNEDASFTLINQHEGYVAILVQCMVTNQIHIIGFEVSLMQHQWDVEVDPFHPPPQKIK